MSKRRIWERESTQALLMIAPNTLGLLIFYIIPILISAALGLFKWNGLAPAQWTGLRNFQAIFNDALFLSAIKNTALYTLTVVPAIIILTLLFGSLLEKHNDRKGEALRLLYLLPIMTMPAAAAMIWKWLLNQQFGLVNNVLRFMGVSSVPWLSSPRFILFSIIIVGIWLGFAFNLIIVISGIKGIPSSCIEAARIDGASPIQRFFNVTLPLLTPTIFFILVTQLIACFQVFDAAFIILGDDPPGVLKEAAGTMVISIYESGFIFFKMGYSSAQAFILFLIILTITIFQFRGQKKWVHYAWESS